MHVFECVVGNRFEADEQATAAAARAQREQFLVACKQACRQSRPLDVQRRQCREQLACVIRVGDEVEVNENCTRRPRGTNLVDNFIDRLLVRLAAPGKRHNAEIATMRAAARRFEYVRSRIASGGHQVAPRPRSSGERQVGRLVIAGPQVAGNEVAQQFWPGIFGIADNDRIGVRLRVVGHQRDVWPTHDDPDPPLPEVRRDFIGALRRTGDNGDADQVDVEILRNILDAFVIHRQFVLDVVGNQCGQCRQCQRRISQRLPKDAAAMTVQRALRRQQCNPDHLSSLTL